MKRLILLSIVLWSFLFGHSQSTLNVSPDTAYLGQNLNILFSGSNLNFQQGSSTCQYVYFEQGSNMVFFPNDNLNVINSNQAFSNFTFQQASSTCGNYNAVLVNYCQGSATSKTFPNALFVKCGSLVAGRIYKDLNKNGVDNSEPAAYHPVVVSPSGQRVYPDSYTGEYAVNLPPGTHQLRVDTPQHFTSAPLSRTVTITNDTSIYGQDFGLYAPNPVNDVQVSIYGTGRLRVGFSSWIHVFVSNNGSTNQQPKVSLQLPSEVSVVSSDVLYTGGTGGLYQFTLPYQLESMESFGFSVELLTIPTAPMGQERSISATTINYLTPDAVPADNADSALFIFTNSYDPNDKQVSPPGFGVNKEVLLNTELEYTIRFQNTGNDVAYNVRIEDLIDQDLDLNTFKFMNSSHTVSRMAVNDNGSRKVIFYFDNIYLPDSSSDQLGSNGFVSFKIKPKGNMAENTVVDNTAEIYFDFNSAIITNTTTTKFVEFYTSIVSVDKETDFALFPNPVLNNQFTLILNEFSVEQNYTLKVYDVSGRSVLNKTLSEKQTAISTGKVAKGTYFVEIAKGTQKTVKKLIFE